MRSSKIRRCGWIAVFTVASVAVACSSRNEPTPDDDTRTTDEGDATVQADSGSDGPSPAVDGGQDTEASTVSDGGDGDTSLPKRERLLAWLKSLAGRTENRVLIGQEVSSWDAKTYETFVGGLEKKTGKRPAIVGFGLLGPGLYDTKGIDALIDHHERGGLVTLNAHWSHPWKDYPPGGDQYRVKNENAPKPDLRELLSTAPDSPQKTFYWSEVEDLVQALTKLRDAGAIVLLRPFHEMNGPWFWWGHDMTKSKTAIVDLWRDLHTYLTARFDNLLWVYAPATSWNASIKLYDPGPEYVDLAGLDLYDDALKPRKPEKADDDWTEITKLGYPGGLTEFGPASKSFPNGLHALVDRLNDTYKTAIFAHAWTSWSDYHVALVDQPDVDWALDQPAILTLDEVQW